MSEAQVIETNSVSHNRNLSRIERDEKELKALLEGQGVNSDEKEEEPPQAELDSSQPTGSPVQTEGDTEQKEEPKGEAQKADTELSSEEKSFKKRYSDIRRHMQDKEQEWKLKLEKLESQLNLATKNELVLPKSEKDIEAWAKKYPDVAGIVEAIADKKAKERSDDLDVRLKEIEDLRVSAKKEKAEAELYSFHPDFNTIRKDDKFHDWAEAQPKWVQDALYENTEDAKAVARVIDLYKSDKGIKNTRKNSEDRGAASSVSTKRTVSPNQDDTADYIRESQVAKMSIKEYEKRMNEITEAQRKGKFIYDISNK